MNGPKALLWSLLLLALCNSSIAQTLTEYYRKSECGLNFAYAGQKVTNRQSAGGTGSGFPSTVTLAGIPATAKIDKAIMLYENSYNAGSPLTPNVTITAPGGASLPFNIGPIGQHVDKCWSEVGTRAYRFDITSIYNGNGAYVINSNTPPDEVDGVALFVFYVDTVANYQGSIIFYDGLFTNNTTGGAFNLTMTNLKPCSASSKADAFMLVGDYQLATHNTTLNGKAGAYSAGFWQLDRTTTTITANQQTSTFSTNATVTDCFSVIAAGLYFQTTACPLLQVGGSTTICPLDSASLTASGGKSFKWSPTTGLSSQYGQNIKASPATTTTYTVSTVCETKTVTVTVDGPTAIATTVAKTHCDLSDGSITVTGTTGGKSPYTYAIDGGTYGSGTSFTNLANGDHDVSVKDANGCVYTTKVNVGNLPGITNILATPTNAICNNSNGKIDVTGVTGGTSPYTYAINGGTFGSSASFGGLAPGSYPIKVKDANGCEYEKNFVVGNSPGPTNMTATIVGENCSLSNGSITITGVTGGTAAYSYGIDGGALGSSATFSGLTAGTHTVKVRDVNNCEYDKTFTVGVIAGPTNILATLVDESCDQTNGSIKITSVTGGTSPYTYSIDGGPFTASVNYINKAAGTYSITAKDNAGCEYKKDFVLKNSPPPSSVTFTTKATGCTTPIGEINVGTVTGGQSPYQYSRDGVTYQTGTKFSGLSSGSYQLFVKDARGCVLDTVAQINSLSGPNNANHSAVADTCSKTTGAITILSVTGGTTPYTYSIDGTTFKASNTFNGLTGGNYSITVKDNTGCTYAVGVTVPTLIGVSDFTILSDPEKCNLKNGRLTIIDEVDGASPFSYSLDGVTFQASNIFNSLDSGKYTITVKDNYNCIYAKTDSVKYLPPVDSVQVQSISATCGQANGKAYFTAFGGTPTYTYSVDGSPAVAADSATNLSVGSHVVTVIDANSCQFPQTFTIGNLAGPTAITDTLTPTACTSPTGTYTVNTVIGGVAPYEYSYDNSPYQASGSFTGLSSGTNPIFIRDVNGCVYQKNITIPVVAGPTAIYEHVVNTLCSQNNGQLVIDSASGGTQPYSWSVNGSPFTTNTTYSNISSGNYLIEVKDANGCSRTKTVTISDSPGPTAVVVTPAPTACFQSIGSVQIGTVTGGTPAYDYSINGSPFTTTKNYPGLPTTNYVVVVRDANGCLYTAPAVFVDNIPGPSDMRVVIVDDTCSKGPAQIRFVSVNGPAIPFEYSVDSGVTWASNPLFSPASIGRHVIMVRDTNGCVIDSVVTLKTFTAPSGPNLVLYQPHCSLPDGAIKYLPSSVTGGTTPFVFSLNGVKNPSGNKFTGLTAGTYQVVVTDKYGCTGTRQGVLVDIPGPTDMQVTSTKSTCSQPNGSIEVLVVNGGTQPISYSLSTSNYQASPMFTNLSAGNYQVYIKDSAGCMLPAEPVTVVGEPGPTDFKAGIKVEDCDRVNGALLKLEAVGGTAPFVFDIGASRLNENDSLKNIAAGTYTVLLTDVNNCTYSKDFTVPFNPAPVAGFNADPTFGEAPLLVKFSNTSQGATRNVWDFGTGDSSLSVDPIYTYQDSGRYEVKLLVLNDAGCRDSATATIRVLPSVAIYTPNGFSPNDDGYNDTWSISTYNIVYYDLIIYNRFGELIKHLSLESPVWKGDYNGEMCQDDVYVFRLKSRDIFGNTKETFGRITLFK